MTFLYAHFHADKVFLQEHFARSRFGPADVFLSLFHKGCANSLAYDGVLTGLQHPDANDKGVRIRRDALVRLLASVWVQFD